MTTIMRYKRQLKVIMIIIAFSVIVVSLTAQKSYAETEVASGSCGENTTWTLYDDKTLIIRGTGSIDDHYEYDDYLFSTVIIEPGVTGICDFAFSNSPGLESVTIPDSVISIGDYVFYDCKKLKNVVLPQSVEQFGDTVFGNCSSLTSIILPEGIKKIDNFYFNGCSSLTHVTIPSSVTIIGDNAFFEVKSLKSITIPEGVKTIGDGAFWGCKQLSDVSLPSTITKICEFAFCECKSLKTIVIPDGVTKIGDSVFDSCTNLTKISLPDGITVIDDCAFKKCYSLKSIVIPKNVKAIHWSAFENCKSLKEITFIGTKVKSIDEDAFRNTPKKMKLICPKSVKKKYKKMLIEGGARYYRIKIKFNPNGGKVKKKSKKVYPYNKYGKLPKPKKKNYDFAGWYTKKKGGYKEVSSDYAESLKGRTLYAHWKKPKMNFACNIYYYNTRNNTISIALENRSKHPVTVLPYGAKVIDDDYKKYDRRLKRSKSVKIGYKKDKEVVFKVVGKHTWPGTSDKTMYLYVKFCGKRYRVKCDDDMLSRYKRGRKWKDTFNHKDDRWEGWF